MVKSALLKEYSVLYFIWALTFIVISFRAMYSIHSQKEEWRLQPRRLQDNFEKGMVNEKAKTFKSFAFIRSDKAVVLCISETTKLVKTSPSDMPKLKQARCSINRKKTLSKCLSNIWCTLIKGAGSQKCHWFLAVEQVLLLSSDALPCGSTNGNQTACNGDFEHLVSSKSFLNFKFDKEAIMKCFDSWNEHWASVL